MTTRSRGGCIDCKRAKVKCDEVRPSCGTCSRRRHVCQGYKSSVKIQQRKHQLQGVPYADASPRPVPRGEILDLRVVPSSSNNKVLATEGFVSSQARAPEGDGFVVSGSRSQFISPLLGFEREEEYHVHADSAIAQLAAGNSFNTNVKHFKVSVPNSLPSIPPGMVQETDIPSLELYFSRHPAELVMGTEFVDEMNANVLMVLQCNPRAIGDSLCAIGQTYVDDNESGSIAIVQLLDRRARILARLRSMNDPAHDLELMVFILLGLCALELIDSISHARETQLLALVANAASLIRHYVSNGLEVTAVAKYFIRALARQDMILSLTHFHRPLIPTVAWLDEESRISTDRFMGYTATLIPLLGELSALAEDMRRSPSTENANNANAIGRGAGADVNSSRDTADLSQIYGLSNRAADIRARIDAWRPNRAPELSFRLSRKFLCQAYAYRSAALLYLHRLFHSPSISPGADSVALAMAHDVLVYTSGRAEELKMLLWPVFIAACELANAEDRKTAEGIFDAIYESRRTTTAAKTKRFCVERVWSARDEGLDWNWMVLTEQYPGECMPI